MQVAGAMHATMRLWHMRTEVGSKCSLAASALFDASQSGQAIPAAPESTMMDSSCHGFNADARKKPKVHIMEPEAQTCMAPACARGAEDVVTGASDSSWTAAVLDL